MKNYEIQIQQKYKCIDVRHVFNTVHMRYIAIDTNQIVKFLPTKDSLRH